MNFNKMFSLLNSKKFVESFNKALENELLITTEEMFCIIVKDYIKLIKYTKIKHIKNLKILKDDIFNVFINGKEYNFDMLISHNNTELTEAKMEIEALLADNPQIEIEMVQSAIIEKFTY